MGDGAVGKTSLRRTFMGMPFEGDYQLTIGADFSLKELLVGRPEDEDKFHLKFQIWDLAGQPRFQEVRSLYYSGSMGAVLVYDMTRPKSFENIPNWLSEIKKYSKKGPVPVVLLANKSDLKNESEHIVETDEGIALSQIISKSYYSDETQQEIPFFETSAKTGENVEAAFTKLAELIYDIK